MKTLITLLFAFYSTLAISSVWEVALPKLKPYSELLFPPMMSKNDFQRIVEDAANKIPYKKGYYMLGENTDFMHGHILFTHKDGRTDWHEFRTQDTNWDGLTPVAVLFHTQEFSNGWTELFSGKELKRLDKLNNDKRNWLMWLRTTGLFHWEGRVEDARNLVRPGTRKNPHTVYDTMLDQKHFGDTPKVEGNWSFHFYRVDCQRIPEKFHKDSNFIKIFHKKEKKNICLLLNSINCEEGVREQYYCPGVDIDKLNQLPANAQTADLINS